MASIEDPFADPFTPYWKLVGPTQDPYSWVFFVVASIASRSGLPVAVVSSVGDNLATESVQGPALLAVCHRILTIFGEPANHAAVRAELSLAEKFYTEDANGEEDDWMARSRVSILRTVELLDMDRRLSEIDLRRRPWDRDAVHAFPFITTCLMQGVGLDSKHWDVHAARPEPLGTVYRDSSGEWGMVVIDISNLDAVRYGIVGFKGAPVRYVSSPKEGVLNMGIRGPGAFEPSQAFRVVEDERPRIALSAAEYVAKFENDEWLLPEDVSGLLDGKPLVDEGAMSVIWPTEYEAALAVSAMSLSANAPSSASETVATINTLIRQVFDGGRFDASLFDSLRNTSNFKQTLRRGLARTLRARPAQAEYGTTIGALTRFAFTEQAHLGLELIDILFLKVVSGSINRHVSSSGSHNIT